MQKKNIKSAHASLFCTNLQYLDSVELINYFHFLIYYKIVIVWKCFNNLLREKRNFPHDLHCLQFYWCLLFFAYLDNFITFIIFTYLCKYLYFFSLKILTVVCKGGFSHYCHFWYSHRHNFTWNGAWTNEFRLTIFDSRFTKPICNK